MGEARKLTGSREEEENARKWRGTQPADAARLLLLLVTPQPTA
jgi:hypothetical protein